MLISENEHLFSSVPGSSRLPDCTFYQSAGLEAGGVEGLQCRWGRIFSQLPWGQKCFTKEAMGTSGHLAQTDTFSQTARWRAWGQLPKIRLHWKRSRSDWWIWVVLMSRQKGVSIEEMTRNKGCRKPNLVSGVGGEWRLQAPAHALAG